MAQPAGQLQLSVSHALSQGEGTVVAVPDTSAEASHPALTGRLQRAWDYVDDDPDPAESRNGRDDDGDKAIDESYGQGTFVAGTVALTAPKARIRPMRVLNSDGRGNLFVVAEAIIESSIDDALPGRTGGGAGRQRAPSRPAPARAVLELESLG